MKIEIKKIKYNIGDKVWYILDEVDNNKVCTACSGVKKIFLAGEEFTCPKCYGQGSCSSNQYLKKIKSSTIKSIHIYNLIISKKGAEAEDGDVSLSMKNNDFIDLDNNCFKTKNEAEMTCKLNKIIE